MKNIEKSNPFSISIYKSNIGIVTILTTEIAVSAMGNITFEEKTLLANYIYKNGDAGYNLHYTVINTKGETESYIEDNGILPTLFLSPEQKNYVSLVQVTSDKEQEINLPVFNRDVSEIPKANKPFTGKYIWTTEHYSIFYDIDNFSSTKPDKLIAFEFKEGLIKKKISIKIPLPKNNKIFIENNEIHLLAKEGDDWIHRQIDEKVGEINRRKLKTKCRHILQVISLSYEKESFLLAQDLEKILIEKIDVSGNTIVKGLIDFPDRLYNTWRPERISYSTYVIRFNTEFGNGWFTIRNDELIEFFYSKDVKNYKNILSDEVLEIEEGDLLISGINKTTENAYAVIFHLKQGNNNNAKNNKLIILNREIKNK